MPSRPSLIDLLLTNPHGWGNEPPRPQQPAYQDDAGNSYGFDGSILDRWRTPQNEPQHNPSLADSLVNIATSPAKLAYGMVAEPYNALARLGDNFVTADGRLGLPNPQNPENQTDMATLLMAGFGSNAFRGSGAVRAAEKAPAAFSEHELARMVNEYDWNIRMTKDRPPGLEKPTTPHQGTPAETSLPMDDASRLARAQEAGYDTDTVYYHGSYHTPFDGFDPNKYGARDSFWGPGVYAAKGPKGEEIAQVYTYNPDIQLFDGPTRYGHYRAMHSSAKQPFDFTPENVKSVFPEWEPTPGLTISQQQGPAFAEALKRSGYDHIRSPDGQHDVFLYPEQLRDVNAAFDPANIGKNGLMLSDTGRPSLLGSAVAAENAKPKGITAYHGSPHDFDRFDSSKIGTGEGAQAYGSGLYFAESEGVAKSYRDALSGGNRFLFDGQSYSPDNPSHRAALVLERNNGDVGEAITDLQSNVDRLVPQHARIPQPQIAIDRAAIDFLKSGARVPKRTVEESGHLYQVRINAEPEQFLDWDKPLAQQSEAVKGAVERHPMWTAPLNEAPDNLMRNILRDPESTGQLRDAGIPGIRYLDQMSRGKGEGSHNYVVFDDSLIEILKKYGLAGLMAGGAAATGEQQNALENYRY